MKKPFLAIITSLILIASINTATAEHTTPAFSFENGSTIPSHEGHFYYELTPGSKIKDAIVIKNLDPERKIKVTLSIRKDAPKDSKEKLQNIPENWILFIENPTLINPSEEKAIEFTIQIPESTEISKYNALVQANLFSFERDASEPTSNKSVNISIGIAKPITIDVKEGNPIITDKTENIKKFLYEKRIELVLILIIIILLIKISLKKKRKKH